MKNTIARVLLLTALLYPASRAAAEGVPHDTTLNVSAGGFSFATMDQLRSQPVFDLRLGYDIIGNSVADSIGIEGGISYISTQSKKDAGQVSAYLFRVDAIFPFFPRSRVVPFFTVGAGGMFMDRGTTLDTAPVLAYGVGMKYFIQEFIALRADLHHNLLFDLVTRNDYQYTVGLSFLLDRDKKIKRIPIPPPPVEKKPKPVLPLAPAVPDIGSEPQPATPSVPKVEPGQSLPKELLPENEPEAKRSELSVPLPLLLAAPLALALPAGKAPEAALAGTSAPGTPGERAARVTIPTPPPSSTAVESVPVAPLWTLPAKPREEPLRQAEQTTVQPSAAKPQSEESMGVHPVVISNGAAGKENLAPLEDSLDEDVVASILCPDRPPAGSAPRTLPKESVTVQFGTGSATVKREYLRKLKNFAAYVKKHPEGSLYIEGHADNRGTPALNQRLTKRRVANLKRTLTRSYGLTKTRIVMHAFGCRVPIDDNKLKNGRARNRRATVEVVKP